MQKSNIYLPPLTKENVLYTFIGTILVALIVFFFWMVVAFHQIILVVFLAIVLSMVFTPIIRWLQIRTKSLYAATIITFGIFFVSVMALVFFVTPILSEQTQVIRTSIEELYLSAHTLIQESENPLFKMLIDGLPEDVRGLSNMSSLEGDDGSGSRYLITLTSGLIYGAVVIGLAFFWSLESEKFVRTIILLLPRDKRESAGSLIKQIEEKLASYILGQSILCASIFVLALILYLTIGLQYALLLAVIAGLFEAIPAVGPSLGAIPALIIALSGDPLDAVWVILGTMVIQVIENNLLVPRVMTRALGVRPFVTLISILIFGTLFGLLGAIVAVPLAVIVETLLTEALFQTEQATQSESIENRNKISVIQYETQQVVQDVRRQIRSKSSVASAAADQIEDSIEAIAIDLDSYLSMTNIEAASR